jgi:hypothetical protein
MPEELVEPFHFGRWPRVELGRWILLADTGVVLEALGTVDIREVIGFLF